MITIKQLKNKVISRGKPSTINYIFAVTMISICLFTVTLPQKANADFPSPTTASYVAKEAVKKAVIKTIKVVITAYSSTPDQTDDTPFITASGKTVSPEIIANNGLPFGTKIRIPALYGDKIFVVGDRMNRRYDSNHFDIWMPSRELALKFGVKTAEMEVLEN